MISTKNSNIYSDKFVLSVVDLSKINLATEEDKAYGIDKWAKLFKATTWEELKTMAAQNTVFEDVAKSMFMYSCNKDVLEDQKYVKHLNDENKSLKADNNELKANNDELKSDINDLKADISELEAENNELAAKNAELMAEIANLKKH
jgi:cell division protein FtsB